MATLAAPPRPNRILPRKPQSGAKAMTIAIGLLGNEGLVLAADRQFTHTGYHKYSKKKYATHTEGYYEVTLMFSGTEIRFLDVHQKVTDLIKIGEETNNLSVDYIRLAIDGVLESMGM